MGSDNGVVRRFFLRPSFPKLTCRKATIISISFCLILTIYNLLPPPELVLSDTFGDDDNHVLLRNINNIPSQQCLATARRLQHCQQVANHTLVLSCHRKWCNSFGHCSRSPGLGDRLDRHALPHVQHALNKCERVLLDYPLSGVSIRKSLVYQDKRGWLAELFRFRSYPDLSERKYKQYENDDVSYSHFMSPVESRTYDACLFHAMFRPNAEMQRELNIHNKQIMGDSSSNDTISIGIHFRTGDGSSFEGVLPEDVRIRGSLEQNWKKMRHCAQQLGRQLANNNAFYKIKYYLATDNQDLKQLVRRENDPDVYMTDLVPRNFRGGPQEDRSAWLELFLLSQRQGLVMNVRTNQKYESTAARLSTFAVLARKIGFYKDEQVRECVLDDGG